MYLAEVALALLGRDADQRESPGKPGLPSRGHVDGQQSLGEALGQLLVAPQRLLQRRLLDSHGHELHLGDLHPVRGDNQELLLVLEGDALVRDHRPHGSHTAQIGHGLTEHTLRSLELLDSVGDLTGPPAQHSFLDRHVGSEEVSRSAEQGVAVARQAVGVGGEELLGDLALTLLEGRAVDSTHGSSFL